MEVFEAISKRFSCRDYAEREIEQDKLAKVFEAAILAPSGHNTQDWRFVVVTDKTVKTRLAAACNEQYWLEQAGAIIVGCTTTDYVMSCGQPMGPIDVAIALEHIVLQAVSEGLATCWIGAFSPEKAKEIVGIPQNIPIVSLMAIGYPRTHGVHAARKSMKNFVCYEKWQF